MDIIVASDASNYGMRAELFNITSPMFQKSQTKKKSLSITVQEKFLAILRSGYVLHNREPNIAARNFLSLPYEQSSSTMDGQIDQTIIIGSFPDLTIYATVSQVLNNSSKK